MAALGLLAFLLESATDEERAAIAEDPGPIMIWSTREPPPDSEEARREARYFRAGQARVAIVARMLARSVRPRATARDPATMHRTDFDLEWLRGNEGYVDWSAGTLNIPPRGHLPAIYRVAIEVGAVPGEAAAPPMAAADLDAIARDFIADHPALSRRGAFEHRRDLKLLPYIPRKVFETLDKGGADNRLARKKPRRRR